MKNNILITSIARKVPLIKAVRNAIQKCDNKSILYGGDCSAVTIGRYFVDEYWEMPRDEHLSFEEVLQYCNKNSISVIIPTRDEELLLWAKYRNRLAENKINVMIPDYEVVESCVDKLSFFQKCNKLGYTAIPTFTSIEPIESDLFVIKERMGGERPRKIGIGFTREQTIDYAKHMENPIYQPLIEGNEISADLYVSGKNNVKGAVLRRRDLIVPAIGGESHVTTTFRNKGLEQMCMAFAKDFKLYGHAVLQVLIDNSGGYHIIECNTRFGGASTTSIAAGLDSFYWFLLEAWGIDISKYPFQRLEQEIRQVRFPQDMILDGPDI